MNTDLVNRFEFAFEHLTALNAKVESCSFFKKDVFFCNLYYLQIHVQR